MECYVMQSPLLDNILLSSLIIVIIITGLIEFYIVEMSH